jgi:hypothetical protein
MTSDDCCSATMGKLRIATISDSCFSRLVEMIRILHKTPLFQNPDPLLPQLVDFRMNSLGVNAANLTKYVTPLLSSKRTRLDQATFALVCLVSRKKS